ncbi:MAG: alpha/beta hydrolase [Bacteroidetes bacterium]|nr:alpha/beta hydrolase [Bacteroidota bacterium]
MEKYIPFKETVIRITDQGAGKIVVLIHGYLESIETWSDFASELSKHFRVVSVDLPGHGKSGTVGTIHTMDMMAEAVNRVLESLGIEKCTVVGHSMGGYVTLAFAEKHPEKLESFCLFHSAAGADNDEKRMNRNRDIGLVREGKKELICNLHVPKTFADDNLEIMKDKIEIGREIARNTPDEGIIAVLEGMKQRPERYNMLKNSKVPVLFIIGKKDNFFPAAVMEPMVSMPEKAEVLLLENTGHNGFIEEKELSLYTIIKFVNNL